MARWRSWRAIGVALPWAAVAGTALGAPGSPKPRPRSPFPAKAAPAAISTPRVPMLRSLAVWPESVTLAGPRAERQLLVTGLFSDGERRDLTDFATYRSTQPARVQVTGGGLVSPTGVGAATVKVAAGGVVAAVRVTAAGAAPEAVRFRSEVLPVLTRAGCNQGACHAAQAGKGGFKLSLLGFDPEADHRAIQGDAGGRRVNRVEPGSSLLLLKPSMAVPHGGGLRLRPGSYEYQVVAGWLADGAPGPRADEPEVTAVEVYPPERRVRFPASGAATETVALPAAPGQPQPRRLRLPLAQQLAVLARRKDGSVADVTRRALLNSLNDGLAAVDGSGRVRIAARGQAAVMVRYLGKAAVARFVTPYRSPAGPVVNEAAASFVDRLTAAKWRQLGLSPSPPCTDAEFIRRVYLDVLGVLPTPDEVRAFLAEGQQEARKRENWGPDEPGSRAAGKPRAFATVTARAALPQLPNLPIAQLPGLPVPEFADCPVPLPTARQRLVDRVLARPEYADYWTLKWGDLLRNHSERLGDKGMWSFYNWLRAAFRANQPADRFARELVTAQGSTFTNGPANYFRVVSSPPELAETTAQVFLGVRLQCARCHHHPFEKWTQDDYWQMAAFFARVGTKGSDEFGIFGGEQVVRLNAGGEVRNPRTGEQMRPTPLDGAQTEDPVDPRRPLATWLTSAGNPFFARNVVNRYWGYLLGRGLYDPVDDQRVTNPPSNPELLDALAGDFAAHGFDLKRLLRTILNSRVYQLSAQPTPENRADEVFYTKYGVKRLGAEELLDAVSFATGSAEKFPNLPPGFRAVQLPDPSVQSYFLEVFGRPARVVACECERAVEPNMAQALHLMNSDFVQNKLAAAGGRIARLLADKQSDTAIIEELYLVTFSRLPAAAELERARAAVNAAPSKKDGFEDLLWALLNSREFLFIH